VWGGFTTIDVSGDTSPVRLDPGEFFHTWILNPVDAQEFFDEPTLLRILFNFTFNINIDNANAAGTSFGSHVYASFIVGSEDDLAGPGFKNPGDTTQQWVWWYNNFMFHRAGDFVTWPFISLGAQQPTGFMDLKTRRKIPEGYGLSAQVWNSDVMGPDFDPTAIDVFACGRILFNDH